MKSSPLKAFMLLLTVEQGLGGLKTSAQQHHHSALHPQLPHTVMMMMVRHAQAAADAG